MELFSALAANNLAALSLALSATDAEARDAHGVPALLHATSPRAAAALLTAGADANAVAPRGTSALHCAATRGSAEIVRLLLDASAAADAADAAGVTPLMSASLHGHTEARERERGRRESPLTRDALRVRVRLPSDLLAPRRPGPP